jgi:hypothetical protein
MFAVIRYFSLLLALFHFSHGSNGVCEDMKNNLVLAESPKHPSLPVQITDFRGTVYKPDFSPSCNDGRPTVVLPGWVKLFQGKIKVPKKYDLMKSGTLKLTVRGLNYDDPLCKNGQSQYIALPHSFCSLNLCTFIGEPLCHLLETPGVHTIKELEEKLDFNSTLPLPEPPSLLGISLLDLFSGEFSFSFELEVEGEIILQMDVPTNEKFLQIGITSDDDDE